MKKKSPYLIVAYLLSTVGIAATGALLFFSKPKQAQTLKVQDTLGFVKPEGPDIRVRGEDDPGWNKITRDANVYQNDRVFTGQSSTALVSLKDQSHLRVEPNSLIKISDQSKIPIFDIKDGGLFGELKKNAKFFIKSGNHLSEFKSQGAVIQIHGTGDKIQLTVLKGEATVHQVASVDSSGNESEPDDGSHPSPPEITVKANQALTMDEKTNEQPVVEEFNVELLKPEPGQVLWDQGHAVDFAWSSQQTNKKSHVEISQDPQFKSVTNQFDSDEAHGSLLIQAGHVYFWRVVNENQRDNSPTSSFAFYSLKGPTLEKYLSFERKIDSGGNLGEPVALNWRDPSMSESYEVEVSLRENFASSVVRERTQKSTFEITNLKEGDYFWRVISKHSGREDLQSDIGRLNLKAIVPLRQIAATDPSPPVQPLTTQAAPPESVNVEKPVPTPEPIEIIAPLKAAKFEMESYRFEIQNSNPSLEAAKTSAIKSIHTANQVHSFEKTSFPHFAFTLDPSADQSRFEWSVSREFDSPRYIELKAGESEIQMHRAPYGKFYVRIISRRGKTVASSDIVSVDALLPAPVIMSTTSRTTPNGRWVVEAKVDVDSRAPRTQIEISDTPTFRDVKVETTNEDSSDFTVLTSGRKFLRAQRLSLEDSAISLPSEVVAIDIPEIAPQALLPNKPKRIVEPLALLIPNELESFVNYNFSTLSVVEPGSNGNADLQLSHDVTVGVRDRQRWSRSFESFQEFSLRAVDFQPSTNSSKALSNTNHVLPHAALGIGHSIGSRIYMRYSLGMENNLALRGLDSNQIAIDSIAEPFAKIQLQARLFSFESTDLFARVSGSYLAGAQTSGYTLLSGKQLAGGIYLNQMLSSSVALEYGLQFSERDQGTSQLKMREQDLGFGVKIMMPIVFGSR